MPRKTVVLVTLIALLAIVGVAQANSHDVSILPFRNGMTFTIGASEVGAIDWGIAYPQPSGFLRFSNFMDVHDYQLDGVSIFSSTDAANALWGDIYEIDDSFCGTPKMYRADWGPYVLDLDPGRYELHTIVFLNKEIKPPCD